MRLLKSATVAIIACFVLSSAGMAATVSVQIHTRKPATRKVNRRRVENTRRTHAQVRRVVSGTSTLRARLVRLSTAIRDVDMDCSHFTNYVYERIGLEYDYAPSAELYKGEGPFVRVQHAMAGDLIVWRGHVGIVVDPQEHTFVSKLNSGVKVASWDARYWKRRGIPRFLRFTGPLNPTPESEVAEQIGASIGSEGASD